MAFRGKKGEENATASASASASASVETPPVESPEQPDEQPTADTRAVENVTPEGVIEVFTASVFFPRSGETYEEQFGTYGEALDALSFALNGTTAPAVGTIAKSYVNSAHLAWQVERDQPDVPSDVPED